VNKLVFIIDEGKFNDNSFLIDGLLLGDQGSLSLYVIENNGARILIDTSTADSAKSIIEKLKTYNIYPIHKILLTHSHWDHVAGVNELKALMTDVDIEVLASESAIDNLKKPATMNDVFETTRPAGIHDEFTFTAEPLEDVTPLKEGDVIDLNGLKLEVFNFFGHTNDSIALLDEKNRNIFTGDAIINKYGDVYVQPAFMPPEFNESKLLKTFQKLSDMKDKLNSISLAHSGVWTDVDFENILDEMEKIHFKTKNSIIQWYKENLSIREIALKYIETYVPNAEIVENELLDGFETNIIWLIEGLKFSGHI
jgi:glyoxylase-like metal-dependent hydrolase (beta-lactamase superfamily II)